MDQLLWEIQEEWSEVLPFQPECAINEMDPYQVLKIQTFCWWSQNVVEERFQE